MARRNPRVTKELPFVSGIQDNYSIVNQNVYLYTTKDPVSGPKAYFKPRNCVRAAYTLVSSADAAPITDTVYSSLATSSNNTYFAGSTNIWKTASPITTWHPVIPAGAALTTYQTEVGSNSSGFVEFQDTTTYAKTAVCVLGTNIYIDNPDSGTAGGGTVLPLGFAAISRGAFLDGYLFLAEQGSSTIFNCDLNDLTTWDTSINLIGATQFSGNITALARTKNYIVAFKDSSIEYFANAGLTQTSPLQRIPQYTKRFGANSASTIAQYQDKVFFINKPTNNIPQVFVLEGEEASKISNAAVEKYLSTYNPSAGSILVIEGRTYYMLRTNGSQGDLVYDVSTGLWYFWNVNSYSFGVLNPVGPTYYLCYGYNGTTVPYIIFFSSERTYDSLDTTNNTKATYTMILDLPPTNFGSPNRKMIKGIAEDCILPPTHTSTVTVNNLVGGNWVSRSKSKTNQDNPNYQSFGSTQTCYIKYQMVGTTLESESTDLVQFNSLSVEIEDGST